MSATGTTCRLIYGNIITDIFTYFDNVLISNFYLAIRTIFKQLAGSSYLYVNAVCFLLLCSYGFLCTNVFYFKYLDCYFSYATQLWCDLWFIFYLTVIYFSHCFGAKCPSSYHKT